MCLPDGAGENRPLTLEMVGFLPTVESGKLRP